MALFEYSIATIRLTQEELDGLRDGEVQWVVPTAWNSFEGDDELQPMVRIYPPVRET